uniref:Uncharacterized protein n=1 Tax=Cucumis melo TaxID=3656 RepID=A0A9I9E4Y5_CUCME
MTLELPSKKITFTCKARVVYMFRNIGVVFFTQTVMVILKLPNPTRRNGKLASPGYCFKTSRQELQNSSVFEQND